MTTEQASLSQKGTAGYPQIIKSESQRQIERDLASAEPIVQAIRDVGAGIVSAIFSSATMLSPNDIIGEDIDEFLAFHKEIISSIRGVGDLESDCKEEKEIHLPDDLDEPTYNKFASH